MHSAYQTSVSSVDVWQPAVGLAELSIDTAFRTEERRSRENRGRVEGDSPVPATVSLLAAIQDWYEDVADSTAASAILISASRLRP